METAMKHRLFALVSLLSATVLMSACQKTDTGQSRRVNGLEFTSGKPSVGCESKTHWTGTSIFWSAGDAIRVGYTCDGVWQNADGTASADEADGKKTAKLFLSNALEAAAQTAGFCVPGGFIGTAEGDYRFYGVFPASSCYDKTGFSKAPCVNVEIPSFQTPLADSFDPSADLMIASSGSYTGIPSEPVPLYWTRLVAHARISLKSLNGWTEGERISKITMTADDGTDMAGRHTVNLLTGEVAVKTGNSAPNILTINGNNLSINASGDVVFWAAFLPCTVSSLKITVVSDKASYTREIQSCSLAFKRNMLNELSVRMSGAVREEYDWKPLPFDDGFDGITKSSSAALSSLDNFTLGGSVYAASAGVVRLAKSDGPGSIETEPLDLSSPFRVTVTAKGWDADELKLTVSSGSQSKDISLQTYGADGEFRDYSLDFNASGCPGTVKFTAAKAVRCYVDRIRIEKCDSEGPAGPGGGDVELLPQASVVYAGCMEFPLVEFSSSAPVTANGTSADDKWFATPTADAGRTLVSHTFSYDDERNRTLSLLFDEGKRCALWVACAFNSTTFGDNGVGRKDKWAYDPALSKSVQPNLSSAYVNDSDGNAYSRGHQVASNDRQTTVEENNQTFYYSNMTPQNQSLNGGQWAQLEDAVQKLGASVSGKDTLYMVTGPVFDSGYKSTTDKSGNVCAIPSRFFKALMICTFDENGNVVSAKGTAYLTSGNSKEANTAYSTWITTIDAVEEITGLDLFANVPAAIQSTAESLAVSLF